MKAERIFEAWSTSMNELDQGLMKTSDRCFHIGIGGGCGLRCAAFCDGECPEPYEFDSADIAAEFSGEELDEIVSHYPAFSAAKEIRRKG